MKDNEQFQELIDELRSLPEPNYDKRFNKQVQDRMHRQLLQFEHRDQPKRKTFQSFSAGIAGVVVLVLFAIFAATSLNGNPQSNELYYTNPDMKNWEQIASNGNFFNEYQFQIVDQTLAITRENTQFNVELPDSFQAMKSMHFSHDENYVAFDIAVADGTKIYVVDLETGEYTNVSDTIGYVYDYSDYVLPYGLAWSPTENILAFVGGYPGSTRVNLYHLDLDMSKQLKNGSFAFNEDLYGVKWAKNGNAIYYVVDSTTGKSRYSLYQTEVRSTDNFMEGGTVEVIKDLNQEQFNAWFKQ